MLSPSGLELHSGKNAGFQVTHCHRLKSVGGFGFAMSGVTVSLANGGATFPGGNFTDNLGNDSVLGGIGADSILGGPGNGTLAGGLGNDSILGGNDAIIAGNSAVRR